MPSPPKKGESKAAFVRRAYKYLRAEGKKHDQAIAIALSMWRRRGSKKGDSR